MVCETAPDHSPCSGEGRTTPEPLLARGVLVSTHSHFLRALHLVCHEPSKALPSIGPHKANPAQRDCSAPHFKGLFCMFFALLRPRFFVVPVTSLTRCFPYSGRRSLLLLGKPLLFSPSSFPLLRYFLLSSSPNPLSSPTFFLIS